jgi:hypothetical protein
LKHLVELFCLLAIHWSIHKRWRFTFMDMCILLLSWGYLRQTFLFSLYMSIVSLVLFFPNHKWLLILQTVILQLRKYFLVSVVFGEFGLDHYRIRPPYIFLSRRSKRLERKILNFLIFTFVFGRIECFHFRSGLVVVLWLSFCNFNLRFQFRSQLKLFSCREWKFYWWIVVGFCLWLHIPPIPRHQYPILTDCILA